MGKLTGLKQAVGSYKRHNIGGYSGRYARMMYSPSERHLWTDEFCDISYSSFVHYNDPSIVCISDLMGREDIIINMKNVKEFIEQNFKED